MAVDTRAFPKNVRVVVRNDNRPDESLQFSGNITLQFDGELYHFPMGKPQIISPEAAYFFFLFDTRCEQDPRGKDIPEKVRNIRDRFTTGSIGSSGIGQQPSLYTQRLMAYGWANDKRKAAWFENFTIKAVKLDNTIDPEAFKAMIDELPKELMPKASRQNANA
jgi:hypothetical protein